MRFTELEVEQFGCVREARVAFGPGLNVLYGPNDLGKSSLAEAIRAVLLLPHGSAAHEIYVPWTGEGTPHVRLAFESAPGTFYRVTKDFGTGRGAGARLERSHDGERWVPDAQSRQVDGRLRELLRWGVPQPGMRGPRGMPDAFLARVLLARQDEVAALLERSLAKDEDASGKEQLSAALQALALDPQFKEVLARAQEKLAEAYTPKGTQLRKQGSPWMRARDAIERAERRVDALRDACAQSASARENLERLRARSVEAEAERARAEEGLAAARAALAAEGVRAAAEARLAAAEGEAARLEGLLGAVREGERAVAARASERAAAAAALAAAEAALGERERAEQALALAAERARAADGAQALALDEERLRTRRLEAEAAASAAGARLEAARRALDAAAADGERRAEVEAAERALGEARARGERAAAASAAAAAALARLGAVEARAVEEERRERLAAAEDARARAALLRADAGAKRAEAAAAEADLAARALPDAPVLARLRALAGDLRVAEARLGVGLRVEVKARRPLKVAVQRDGEALAQERGLGAGEGLEVEASREVLLGLASADVRVIGGDRAARAEAERLRASWDAEGAPALLAAGARDLEALDGLVREAALRRAEAERARGRAAALEAEASGIEASAGDLDLLRAAWQQAARASAAALEASRASGAPLDPSAIAAEAAALRAGRAGDAPRAATREKAAEASATGAKIGAARATGSGPSGAKATGRKATAAKAGARARADREDLRAEDGGPAVGAPSARADAEAALARARGEAERARDEATRADAVLAAARARASEAARAAATARAALGAGADPAAVLAEAEAARAAALRALAEVDGALARLRAAEQARVRDAEHAAAAAADEVRAARARRDGARAALDAAQAALAGAEGQLEERRRLAASVDLPRAAADVEAARVALAALPPPAPGGRASASVEAAERALDDATAALRAAEGALRHAEGVLQVTGGAGLDEQLAAAESALAHAEERQRELEVDYGAWRLLKETLEEVEREEAQHLGRALGGPVGARFAELTGQRYGGLALGASIEVLGVEVAGARQPPKLLSVGTRDQLATVLRMVIAEQLGSALLLDDQLAQSDLRRMQWFGRALRALAARAQVLVFTCRPDEYLSADEMPSQPQAVLDSAGALVRAIDLERVVTRSP